MKKVLSIFLALLMLCSTGTLAFAADDAQIVAQGYCGATVNWKVDSNDMAKYFAYNTALAKTDGTNATATYASNGADTTAPLFTSVTMSPYIHIPETVDNSKKVANTSDGIAAAGANLNANDQYTQDFESCDFKIRVVGWGVKAAAAGDAFSTASTDDVNNIKTGLQGLA